MVKVLLALGVLYGSAYDSIPKVSYHNVLTVYLLGCQFLALIVSFEAALIGWVLAAAIDLQCAEMSLRWGWGVYGDVEANFSIEDSQRYFDLISMVAVGVAWFAWHSCFYRKWSEIADDNKRVRGLFEKACLVHLAEPDKDP